MKPTTSKSRREFLKTAASGAAGMALSSSAISSTLDLWKAPAAWRPNLVINPAIQNFKAISFYDEGMVSSKYAANFAAQNDIVNENSALVEKNMDSIARKLILPSIATNPWNTIFQCPASKRWDQVKVAIKVNCSNVINMPRIAVVGKVCKELIALNVLPGNITLYDSCNNAWGIGKYTDTTGKPVPGLPSGIIVSNTDKTTDTGPLVPIGNTTLKCSSVVAQKNTDNSISYLPDILINCAVNNGYPDEYGGFNMLMMNHLGTIKYDLPTAQELIDINQSEAVIGQGTIDIPCRQQLCIIDSLWASKTALIGDSNLTAPCRIIMGVLAPVVDYLTAENVRKSVMKTAYNTTVVNNWLSAFGYAPSDPIWIELSSSTDISRREAAHVSGSTTIRVSIAGDRRKPSGISFRAPFRNRPVSLRLYDLRGRTVRDITLPSSAGDVVAWNSAMSAGRPLPAGTYTIQCTMGNWVKTALLTIAE